MVQVLHAFLDLIQMNQAHRFVPLPPVLRGQVQEGTPQDNKKDFATCWTTQTSFAENANQRSLDRIIGPM